MSSTEVDFWGNTRDPFVSMREKYGVWPVTVWDIDLHDKEAKEIKALLNEGETRAGSFQKAAKADSKSVYQASVSIFNPSIACWLLNCYAPEEGTVYDPFAGGGTRAIMCAKRGLDYVGVELRKAEVDAVVERCAKVGVSDRVSLLHGDSTSNVALPDAYADFLITCPPYYNLEEYDGGEQDLSMCQSYDEFLSRIELSIKESARVLKPNALSVWVVGLHRENGVLLPLNHDIASLHRKNGFVMREEIVLAQRNNGAVQRVGNFEKGQRFLVRTHEYALVFRRVDEPGENQAKLI